MKGKAVLGITGSIDSGKKSPFFLDKPSGGAAPPCAKRQAFLVESFGVKGKCYACGGNIYNDFHNIS